MKNLIRHMTVLFIISLTFSCNDNFLTDELDHASPENASIVISPDWVAQDYPIYCSNVGNAKFKVIKAPDWLKISSSSGQFINDYATLNCRANVCDDFSEIGIYYSYMTLTVEGKGNLTFLIAYITEGNPVLETENRMTVPYYLHAELPIKNTGNGILIASILEIPEWLSFVGNYGLPAVIEEYPVIVLPQNENGNFSFVFNQTVPISEELSGKIIVITNDKKRPEVEIDVRIDLGNPTFYSYYDQLDFGRTENVHAINIRNMGNGLLKWEIESCPEWLTVSEYSGTLNYSEYETLTFTCNRELLSRGANEGTVSFKTNDKNMSSFVITVTVHNNTANPVNVKEIDGNITDAYFDKQSDILYLTTNQPNRFIAYDAKNRKIAREFPLNHAPNCFSLSEDSHQVIIGHDKFITSIDVDNFSVIKTIEVDYNIFDIEWGDDNWCCYTERQEVQSYLQWKNLNTKETYDTPYILYGKVLIKKIPYQNRIVASQLPPFSGTDKFIIFDIQNRNFVRYFNEAIYNFWFSTDGTHLFSTWNYIYKTSSFSTSSGEVPIGEFSPSSSWIYWIDHQEVLGTVLVLSASSYPVGQLREIRQYEDNNYTRVKTYYYDDFYLGNLVQAHYVFANQAGTELVVIRNVTNGVMWSLEFIPIDEIANN